MVVKMLKNFAFLALVTFVAGQNYLNDKVNPYRHRQVVDTKGKYVLEWEVIGGTKVVFNVTVETRGWVALGLSKKGLMDGADIVVGGIGSNGRAYFSDRHGVGRQRPVIDRSQDWNLLSAWESRTHTFLSFSRNVDTCDEKDDLAITDDVTGVIWAYSEEDTENEYHYEQSGVYFTYLLDPDLTPRVIREQSYKNVTTPARFNSLGSWKVWDINVPQQIPPQDTAYFCTMHKAPTRTKHHIVGIRPVFPSELERRHIHHLILHRCFPPRGSTANEVFGRFANAPGEECYVFLLPRNMPTQYCRESRYEWAVGGGPAFFPEHVGFSLSESQDEYYLLQIHYDNPQSLSNLRLNFTMEVYYTDKLRENEGGVMFIGARPDTYSVMVPPHTLDHTVYGFCASQCTRKTLPSGGINIFAARSHTHVTGKGTRYMYVRDHDKRELPLIVDDNYNFDYQEYRTLKKEQNIMGGDMLYHRCNLQTTNKTTATVGGYSTRNEMCHGWIWYYPYVQNYGICYSEIRSDVYREFLQIYNVTFSNERRAYIVLAPEINAGLTTEEAGTRIVWSLDNRRQLQAHHRFLPQISVCDSLDPDASDRTRAALLQIAATLPPPPVTPPLPPELQPKIDNGHSGTTFTDLDKEIFAPNDEFVNLWPAKLIPYRRESSCPKRKFFG